jgi:peroxiredoxin Q/BCP
MREFRVHHEAMRAAGLTVAGISLDTAESSRMWTERLHLPFPLLSDVDRHAGAAFGVIRRIGLGGWNIEFFRRATFLVDARGMVVAVWERVKVRGHALDIMDVARALEERPPHADAEGGDLSRAARESRPA